jgi:ABC-type multidrug transport system fused ATPase/permease subunit
MALREHFLTLFAVGAALGVFSAARFYMVTWLGERITADLRNAVYAHVVAQSPEFFETTQTGEVLSRLTTDTTLVQTVVGSSLSMGLRNTVMGIGALAMLVYTNPYIMFQVLGILVLVVLPSMYFGRRVRKLSRASQDRVADSSAIAAEVLNAIPVVQSYTQERREATRFDAVHRGRLRDGPQAHAGARVPGRLHDQRHLRRAAVGAVPGHAGGDPRRHHRRPPGADGGLRDHLRRRGGGAVRGLRRPAARRRRHRAPDGAAVGALAGGRPGRTAGAAAHPGRLGGEPSST